MVAKLTLNSSGFMTELEKAERRAKNFEGSDDFTLGLDTTEFEGALQQAQQAASGFKGPTDPKLDLDTAEFDASLTGAETDSENFDGPEDQDVDLDTSDFDESLSGAETDAENFDGPEDQDVDLDTSGFTGAMEGAEERSSDFETNIGGIMQNVAGAIAAAGIGAAITKAFSKLSDVINLASTTADEVDKGSRRLNLSTKAYQEWSHALGQSGATISDFQRGILTVNNLLAGDQISEDATAAFAELGVSMHDANGKLKTTEEFLNDTVIALSKLPSGAKRSNLVTAIFGRGGDSLNALLDSGEEGIQDLIKEAHELGLVMSDEEITNGVAFGDSVANMQEALKGLETSFVTGILPYLKEAVDSITKIITFFNMRAEDVPIAQAMKTIDDNLNGTVASINATASTAESLFTKLWSMGDATQLTADGQREWYGTAQALLGLVPDLSKVIDLDTLSIKGSKDEVLKLIDAWASLQKQRALDSAAQKKQQALVEANSDAVDAQVEANIKAAEAETERQKAIENLNPWLKQQGYQELGSDATLEQIREASSLLKQSNPFDAGYKQRVDKLTLDYEQAILEAQHAQEASDSYAKQVEEAQKEFDTWMETAWSLFFNSKEEADEAKKAVEELDGAIDELPERVTIDVTGNPLMSGFPKAKGDWNVPYDNYPAILHRGEAVLTSSEARRYRDGESGSLDTSTLSAVIAEAIRTGMAGATVEAYMDGKRVTDQVNRRNTNDLASRRYAP